MVATDKGEIEGYVFSIISPKELYVILAGYNKPFLVETQYVRLLDAPAPKRGRGRPRKEKK